MVLKLIPCSILKFCFPTRSPQASGHSASDGLNQAILKPFAMLEPAHRASSTAL